MARVEDVLCLKWHLSLFFYFGAKSRRWSWKERLRFIISVKYIEGIEDVFRGTRVDTSIYEIFRRLKFIHVCIENSL